MQEMSLIGNSGGYRIPFRRANQSSRQKPVYPLRKKYFAFSGGQISSTSSRRPTRQEGHIAMSGQPARKTNGAGCVPQDRVVRTPVAGAKLSVA